MLGIYLKMMYYSSWIYKIIRKSDKMRKKTNQLIDRYFGITEKGSNIKREMLAGVTTFMTMAYILIVNPSILSQAGMDSGAVFTATAVSAIVSTLIMGLYAKLPFAQAPGMGLNAFFAFTIVIGMGYSFQFALTAVFLEGLIFILLTAFNVREAIVDSIPANIKKAISVGIGLFIALIGLEGAGVIVKGEGTLVSLGDITKGPALLAIIGIVITGILMARNVKGALFIGMIITAIIGIPMGITNLPDSVISAPPSISSVFMKFEWHNVFSIDMLIVLFTLLFMDMFDTIGTFIGTGRRTGIFSKEDELALEDSKGFSTKMDKALFADAIATSIGAIFGTSNTTTYVESAAGIGAGGRTGLTSVVVAILFALSSLFSPLIAIVPAQATAPALILVGIMMLASFKDINWTDLEDAIPAFFASIFMGLCYSISYGIAAGFIFYAVVKVVKGKAKEVSPIIWVIDALFILNFVILAIL